MVGDGRVAAGRQGPPERPPATSDPAHANRWRVVAALEVVAAVVAVLADALIPSLVLVVMAALSLAARRAGPATIGLRRPRRPWLLVGQMLALAVGLSLLDVGLLIPIANHVSGRRQDLSSFADLEGSLGLLALYLVLGWTLAAVVEEVAFRGYLVTRIAEPLGGSARAVVVAVVASAALFATLHTEQGLVGALVAGFDGLVYGVLRYRCATLWAPILAHGFIDTIGFVSFFLVGPVYGLW